MKYAWTFVMLIATCYVQASEITLNNYEAVVQEVSTDFFSGGLLSDEQKNSMQQLVTRYIQDVLVHDNATDLDVVLKPAVANLMRREEDREYWRALFLYTCAMHKQVYLLLPRANVSLFCVEAVCLHHNLQLKVELVNSTDKNHQEFLKLIDEASKTYIAYGASMLEAAPEEKGTLKMMEAKQQQELNDSLMNYPTGVTVAYPPQTTAQPLNVSVPPAPQKNKRCLLL